MKKSLLLTLPLLALTSCGVSSSSLQPVILSSSEQTSSAPTSQSQSQSSVAPSSSEASSAPVSSSQTPSSSETPSSSSSAFAPPTKEDFVPRYLEKVGSLASYKAITKGTTKAKVLIFDTTQSIDVTQIKSEYSYLKNESHGALTTIHTAYFHNQQSVYSNDTNDTPKFAPSTMTDYIVSYGVYPFDSAIEGYLCSKEAITSIEPITTNSGYAFKLTFDPEKATTNVRIQMKAFGGLDDVPTFENISISVFTKTDLSPDHLEVVANYKAKKVFESDCHQEYRVDFSDINQTIEIPNLAAIKTEFPNF